jgi:uncharacterized membrane protein
MAILRTRKDPETILSGGRVAQALGAGIAAGAAAALAGPAELAPVIAWLVAAAMAIVWVWRLVWPVDHVETKRLAELESESRTTDRAVLAAAVLSLGFVVLALVRPTSRGAAADLTVVLCVVAVAVSWALVNTVFALKYARHYYLDDDGGINFKQAEPPAYSDFAYMAFTIGMTFQVSETEPATTALRKAVLGHALLSYLFVTGMLAVAVNLVANLAQN